MESDTRPTFTNNTTIVGKLDKYGKLNNCTRRQLMDYCLRLQELYFKISSELFGNGILVTIDDNDNIYIEKHNVESYGD